MKMYTIRDIAEKAGVSVTTVSRVMNHRPDVNAVTRERVSRVIEECGFVCNENARNLKQTDANFAAVIVRGRQNIFLNDITERMLKYAAEGEVSFLLEYIDEKDDEFMTALRLHKEKRAAGFIMLGSRIDERCRVAEKMDLPFVFATVDARGSVFKKASSVCIDDFAMARQVTGYLISGGHRRIAVFGGRRDLGDSLSQRYAGVKHAFEESGLTFDEDLYLETRFSMHGAYECARDFFVKHRDVTAVFCMSDLVAAGVIRALKEMGRQVPEDVSVVGFDGIEIGRYFIPSITTVRQPTERIAKESVDLLLSMMAGESGEKHLTIPAEFVSRESVARI